MKNLLFEHVRFPYFYTLYYNNICRYDINRFIFGALETLNDVQICTQILRKIVAGGDQFLHSRPYTSASHY